MGLKYIETIKSVVLFVLVMISVALTFTIWTYTPNHETLDSAKTIDISIAEKKKVEQLITPYKVIYRNDVLRGSHEEVRLSELLDEMKDWSIRDLTLEREQFTKERVDELMSAEQSLLLYYFGEVPFRIFENIITVQDGNVPEGTFDRLVVTRAGDEMEMHFINRKHEYYYTASVTVPQLQRTENFFLTWSNELDVYEKVLGNTMTYLAIPQNELLVNQNTYYQEEVTPTRFRDALFADPNAVRRSQIGSVQEEYADNHALMTVDMLTKQLNYVYPSAESNEIAIPSELLYQSIDFINEHGGWTDDYRYVYMNPITRYTRFKLFVEGLPVHSETKVSTEIVQQYGEGRVFRYTRPYYTFDVTLLIERNIVTLPSGVEVIEHMKRNPTVDLGAIEDVIVGYRMQPDFDNRLFKLIPAWFYSVNGVWHHYDLKETGVARYGLG